MKLAVLGNSHVACLKLAWESMRQKYPSVDMTFFAARGDDLSGLEVAGDTLRAADAGLAATLSFTSGGLSEIRTAAFDVVLVYGAFGRPFYWDDTWFYSSAVIRQTLEDASTRSLAFSLLRKLMEAGPSRYYIAHDPMWAARQVIHCEPPRNYLRGSAMLNQAIYRPLGAELVLQPLSTICNGNETLPEFSAGSVRLSVGDAYDGETHPDGERAHMNQAYGELWLAAFFGLIGAGADA